MGSEKPLTPESHPELAAALKDAGLWYEGDKQDGFIKGWLAHQRAGEGEAGRGVELATGRVWSLASRVRILDLDAARQPNRKDKR